MNPFNSRLYGRLLLWFCAANVATLLVSVLLTAHLAHRAYAGEPDFALMAQAADAAYIEGGRPGLAEWSGRTRHQEHIEASLYQDGADLLRPERPIVGVGADAATEHGGEDPEAGPSPERGPLMGPVIQRVLPRLLAEDSIVLRPDPHLLMAGEAVTGADGVKRQLIAVRGPRPLHARLESLLGVQIALSVLAIMVVGWWVARGIALPVAALQRAAQRMAGGDLSARVGGHYPQARDELGLLAREFDNMAARIEALVEHERGVLQDVSHELRSPLARLQLILELARGEGGSAEHLARAEREIARLSTMIADLLTLSRMEADLPGMTRETVDLAALAADCLEEAQIEARARGASLRLETVQAAQAAEVSGNAPLLARAVDNLLSNAIKYANGEIVLRIGIAGGRAEISLRDHGPGLPADELAKVFRPFFRGANAAHADGQGLGLAIVDRIARAHGGTAAAANAEGGGLRVTLSLPMAQPLS
jgi:signal transduction histidine kinase